MRSSIIDVYGFNPQPEPPRYTELGCCADESNAYYRELGQLDGDGYAAPPEEGEIVDLVTGDCPTGYRWDMVAGDCVPLGPVGGGDEGDGEDLPTGGKTPGAVAVREGNWNLDADPAEYTIAAGDTFVGLTKTYLDATGERWRELWNYGWNRQKFPDPDVIMSTGPLQMPPEARDRFVAWKNKGKPGGKTPAQLTTKEVKEGAFPWWGKALIAVGLMSAAGTGIFLLTRRRGRSGRRR